MKNIINHLEQKKQKLDTFRPLDQALLKSLDQWFTVELSYNSNAIEGNTITRRETALVIEKGITVAGKALKDHLEIINYSIALDFIKNVATKKRKDISLQDILDIHRLVLKGIDDNNAGRLRMVPVFIAGSDVKLPNPLQVPNLMNDFIVWLQKTQKHTLEVAAEVHLKLVTIHPFVDGNGRTARLLMNLLFIQAGYPPAVIENSKRSAYIDAIEKAQKTNDLSDFYNFIFNALDKSLDKYLQAAKQTIKSF